MIIGHVKSGSNSAGIPMAPTPITDIQVWWTGTCVGAVQYTSDLGNVHKIGAVYSPQSSTLTGLGATVYINFIEYQITNLNSTYPAVLTYLKIEDTQHNEIIFGEKNSGSAVRVNGQLAAIAFGQGPIPGGGGDGIGVTGIDVIYIQE